MAVEPKIAQQNQPPQSAASAQFIDKLLCFVLRHWLALFLTPMLIFVTLPFFAPVAMHWGWTGVGQLLYLIYSPFCHQLPQRSFFFFGEKFTYTLAEILEVYPYNDPWRLRHFIGTATMGYKVAWSDRMVSFYFMTPVFALIYPLLQRFGRKLKPIPFWLMLLTLTPIMLDGMTHVFSDVLYGISSGGFRDTNGWLATLTNHAFPGFYAGDQYGTFNWWMRLITGVIAAWGLAFHYIPWLDRVVQQELRHSCQANR
ncbi:MAG: DUF2085 domain-containing protein [Caldilineaceae bacterium]